MGKLIKKDEIIKIFNEIWNNFYDYSLLEYINNRTKIKIICPIHGVFEKSPKRHKKEGCPKCNYLEKYNIKNFLEKAIIVHNNFYDYSLVEYVNNYTKVKIICPIHGIFEQTPANHLSGQDCKYCVNNNIKYTTDEFINKSNIKHNYKYTYSKTIYINSKKKVIITCPIHGDFLQNTTHHLRGCGCPICNESKGEIEIVKLLENINFIREYSFDDCKYKKKLPFDFYLPDYNTCIEYDGKQHFQIIEHFGGEKRLKETQIKDKIKTEYCYLNNIQLIRIKYDQNIEEVLNEKLSSLI